ncbi:hypothetical protein JZO70_20215 [Enterococcus sp. 669A]|uniref:Uncharacterized protein n=1 Tax=Candidatus Enterococcus moelleringii TaxID=2815325 RepID=A0ABS3LFV4_9ENTE|nr:hypothetical protein [Enterococcus sp. 669A]MBO1308510.1 hypothetical protein [Enterococcus sp. 669A]
MLKINYRTNEQTNQKTYPAAKDFIAAQLKEVPDLADYYHVDEAWLDDQKIELTDSTIAGLYNYLAK